MIKCSVKSQLVNAWTVDNGVHPYLAYSMKEYSELEQIKATEELLKDTIQLR